ncbi:MAG: DUF3109 family protein [Crocinitomicaceae bacterium]|nr:DUF3109 family protein [Crocinitomicaceae bacterium]
MLEIGDKLVSRDIFDEEFVCNLGACKGACCVEGDDGAPLTMEEVDLLEDYVDEIKPYMTEEGKAAVNDKGVFYLDRENEPVTALVKGKECAFVYRDNNGITKCSVETAYKDGKIPFNKPISCHLYPIRSRKFEKFEALNYDRWPICKDACTLGKDLSVPVYKFLKEPLIRKYGEDFYAELEEAHEELKKLS